MKEGKIFFHPIEGSGQLGISWSSGPKGNAIEAKHGSGVGFFSPKGDLLSVIFDEIESLEDHQVLEFSEHTVEVIVKRGKVVYKVQKKSRLTNRSKRPIVASRKRIASKIKR